MIIPKERRRVIPELLKAHNVVAVFSGHWHRNVYGFDGEFQMVTSGPVGYPLGDDPSGYRIVKVHPDRVEHDYYALGSGPDSMEL